MALAVASGAGAGGGVRRGRLVPRLRGRERLAVRRRPDRPPDPRQRYAAYASGLAVMGMLVLKLAGLAGAPLVLGLILAAVPAILGRWGLLPT